MNKKYHIKLNAEERKIIQKIMNDEKTSTNRRKRSNILLQADESVGQPPTQEEISVRCGVSDVTVYTVIKEYDTQGMAYCLRKRIHATPPNPPIVTGEKEARIVALACGATPEGRTRWTVRLLAKGWLNLELWRMSAMRQFEPR